MLESVWDEGTGKIWGTILHLKTFWQGMCSLCGAFLKFHTCDRRERGRGGGNRIISRPFSTSLHILCALFLSISDSHLGVREKSPPCGSPQKYKEMYWHKPHILFTLSLFHTLFSMHYAVRSISFLLIFTTLFTFQHTTQIIVFHFWRSCKLQFKIRTTALGESEKKNCHTVAFKYAFIFY